MTILEEDEKIKNEILESKNKEVINKFLEKNKKSEFSLKCGYSKTNIAGKKIK